MDTNNLSTNQMKTVVTLRMVSEETAVLQRNGQDMVCPMMPPITSRNKVQHPIYGMQDQVQVQKSPCNSSCPLFDIHNETELPKVSVNCGGNRMIYQICKIEPFKAPEPAQEPTGNDAKIINLGGK